MFFIRPMDEAFDRTMAKGWTVVDMKYNGEIITARDKRHEGRS